MNRLFLFTLTWNRLPMLATLNASVRPALEGLNWFWYVKDNGSKDGTVDEVKQWGERVIPYAYPNNRQSFSEGMNYLFANAKPDDEDFVLLLNNDVEFLDQNSIHEMISAMTDDVGIVGARLLYTGTNKLQHAGVVFHEANQLPIHFRSGQENDIDSEKNRTFQAVTGAVLLTKGKYYRQAFQNKSGTVGLDETYQWMYEDIDFCLSVAAMGKKIVYCGKTKISHRESATINENPVNRLFLNQNIKRFREKWHGRYASDRIAYESNKNHNLIK